MNILDMREVSLAASSLEQTDPGLAALIGHPGYEIQHEPLVPIESSFKSYPVGDRSIALMESLGEGTAISRFVDRRGPGIFSLTFGVDDVEAASAHLRANGASVLLDHPMELRETRSGSHRWETIRINFVGPKGPMHGIVVELQELRGGELAASPAPVAAPDRPFALNEVHCAVHDVDEASATLAILFGLEVGPVVVQPHPPEEVRFRNLFRHGMPVFAIIQPATETSSIHRFLARRGEGMFSVSMRVADCAATGDRLRAAGIEMLRTEPNHVDATRIGPVALDAAEINWVKPNVATGKVLFELQQY